MNRLSRQQLVNMLSAMIVVEQESPSADMTVQSRLDPIALADELLKEFDPEKQEYLSREDYLVKDSCLFMLMHC